MLEDTPDSSREPSDRADKSPGDDSTVISVDGVSKTFLMPHHKVHTLKETVLHPLRKYSIDRLPVLSDISFDVKEGEFFGIIGRNGSGKSTLLKCLAGIYRTECGNITIDGRLSPFIELGVGFNPDLNARDNVYVNAALLGLSPREAGRRFDDIIEFAELEEFVDLKFKNYSTGMQVRLGFASAIQVDADILLIDEVLAVGDTSFQQKCYDTFQNHKRQGRTIVFVSHDLGSIELFCDRVLYIEKGEMIEIGKPDKVIRKYMDDTATLQREREQLEVASDRGYSEENRWGDGSAEILDFWIEDDAGNRTTVIREKTKAVFRSHVKFHETMEHPVLLAAVHSDEDDRPTIFGISNHTANVQLPVVRKGDMLDCSMSFETWLTNGRYYVSIWVVSEDGIKLGDYRSLVETFLVKGHPHVIGKTLWPNEFTFTMSQADSD